MAFFSGFGPAFNQASAQSAQRDTLRRENDATRKAKTTQQLRQQNAAAFDSLTKQIGELAKTDPAAAAKLAQSPGVQKTLQIMAPFIGQPAETLNNRLRIVTQATAGPEQVGAAEGKKALATATGGGTKAEALKTTATTTARLSATPNPQNFFNPRTKEQKVIDINDREKVDAAEAEGLIRFSTAVQGSQEDAFGLQDKELTELRNIQTAAVQGIDEINAMKGQLESGKTLTGLASSGVRLFAGAVGTALQVGQLVGQDDRTLLELESYSFKNFGAAGQSQAFRSNMLNLAYTLARARDPGGRLSDRDVQVALDGLAADSGDKNQIIASLTEADRRLRGSVRARARVLAQTNPSVRSVLLPEFQPGPAPIPEMSAGELKQLEEDITSGKVTPTDEQLRQADKRFQELNSGR